MTEDLQQDNILLKGIRLGKAEAWSQLIDHYQGRLLRYAKTRVQPIVDAEDLVQETFLSFVKGLEGFRGECSIETYLFVLLRHGIINRSRSRGAQSICLLQDVAADPNDSQADAWAAVNDPHACVTQHVQRLEDQQRQYQALAKALNTLVKGLKQKPNFQSLMVIELLFYAGLSNQQTSKLLRIDEGNIRVIKHRSLRRLQKRLLAEYPKGDESFHCSDDLIRTVWASQRMSCPKRSTLGAFLLQELDPAWFEYVDFHLSILGCHFCRASFKDLQHQQDRDQLKDFRQRILASTIGFLTRAPEEPHRH